MADPEDPVGDGKTVEEGVEFHGNVAVAVDLSSASEEEEAEAFIGGEMRGEEEHPVDDTAEAAGTVDVADEVFCAKFVRILLGLICLNLGEFCVIELWCNIV